jgi:hypothetical protein
VIIFGSVRFLSKKVTKPKFFFFEKKTEPKPGQTDRFRFGSVFLGQKPVQTGLVGFSGFGSVFFGLARFFRFWLGFFRFGSVFPVWLGFFSGFLSVSVSVWFFWFFVYKTETEPNRLVFSKI